MAEEGEKPEATEVEDDKKSAPAADISATPTQPEPPTEPHDDPDTPVKEDTYEIRINSYKIVSAAGVVAVHNEVAFYRNGEPMIAFNGNAHNNQTGELNTFAISSGNTLRVSAGDRTYGQNGMELVGSVTLGANLTREELLEKLKAATAASQYINSNKIEYVVVGGVSYEAQNSNSVASSLLTAMGYKYPANEFSHVWAPGSKRDLLPNDWKPDLTTDALITALQELSRDRVGQQVRDEKIPRYRPEAGEQYFPNLHDPNKSVVSKAMADFSKAGDVISMKSAATFSLEGLSGADSKTDLGTTIKSSAFKSMSGEAIKFDQDLTKVFAGASNITSTQLLASKAMEGEILKQQLLQNPALVASFGVKSN